MNTIRMLAVLSIAIVLGSLTRPETARGTQICGCKNSKGRINSIGEPPLKCPSTRTLVCWNEDTPTGDTSVRVRNSADYSIPDSAETALTFDTEDYDTSDMHSTSANTHQLIASTAGKYYVFGQVAIATPVNPGVGSRYLRIRINGVSVAQVSEAAAPEVATRLEISTHYALAAGDTVEMYAYADSHGTTTINAEGGHSPVFGMVKVP